MAEVDMLDGKALIGAAIDQVIAIVRGRAIFSENKSGRNIGRREERQSLKLTGDVRRDFA